MNIMKLSHVIRAIAGPVSFQDFSKYHLSWCAQKAIEHTPRMLTGIEHNIHTLKYSQCVYTIPDGTFFDYHCLCRGGDGEGSAIMSMALEIGHVLLDPCGWERTMEKTFPEIRDFCIAALKDPTLGNLKKNPLPPRRRRAL
ncbi:hypothetical protein B0T20DRAFT_411963, partial [Sordaria brevicollis]